MYKDSTMYFCKDFKVEDAKKLYDDFIIERDSGHDGQAKLKFQMICSKMKNRVNDHYISPIKTFLNATNKQENRESYGFIVMGINCILIEFYYEMINGFDESSDGGYVGNAYKVVLPKMDSSIEEDKATLFYKGIRCGIIHQGQTKENTAITFDERHNKIIEKNGLYDLCNPSTLFEALLALYKDYWEMLSHKGHNDSESAKMIEKYNNILKHIK